MLVLFVSLFMFKQPNDTYQRRMTSRVYHQEVNIHILYPGFFFMTLVFVTLAFVTLVFVTLVFMTLVFYDPSFLCITQGTS